MRVQWLGHPAFKIISEQDVVIYIDPWITTNPVCPIDLEEAHDAHIVCVSHGHSDHIGDALEIVRRTGAILVGSPEIAYYAEKHGIGYDQGSSPINIGGYTEIRGIKIHGTPSSHVSAIYGKEWDEEQQMLPNGSCMGFVLEMENRLRVFHPGDTGLTYDLKMIGEVYNPDVAMLPIGGRYTMTPELAALAAQWVRAPKVIPMHYNTAEFNRQDPAHYQQLVNNLTKGVEVLVMKPGDWVTI